MAGIGERVDRILSGNIRDARLYFDEQLVSRLMTPEEIAAAKKAYPFVVRNADIHFTDGLKLETAIEEALDILKVRSISRRDMLIKTLTWGGIGGGIVGGISLLVSLAKGFGDWHDYNYGTTAQLRSADAAREKKRLLEANNLLGFGSIVHSFSGWSVSYAPKNPGMNYRATNLVSRPLEPGSSIKIALTGILDSLEDTGIIISDHLRVTDEQTGLPIDSEIPIVKLGVATKMASGVGGQPAYTIGEEWLLRNEQLQEVDVKILMFKKLSLETKYFSITRTRTLGSTKPIFQLRLFELNN